MTGNYNSVVVMILKTLYIVLQKDIELKGVYPAKDPVSICSALVETDDTTGCNKYNFNKRNKLHIRHILIIIIKLY